MRTRKTRDEFIVQGWYDSSIGWEDVTAADTRKEAREALSEYRENEPQYPYRLIKRRIRLEVSAPAQIAPPRLAECRECGHQYLSPIPAIPCPVCS